TDLVVTTAAVGRFLALTYTGTERAERQDGVLQLRVDDDPSPADMVWVGCLHTLGAFMQFSGRGSSDGSIEAFTSWSPGSGPGWGWRIAVSSQGAEELTMRMFIATPEGEEAPAVESRYTRV